MEKYEKRLWERINVGDEEDCWLWTGGCNGGGYGQISWEGRMVLVHRRVFELLVGPIQSGLWLDHLCRVRRCCNPDHLEAVTPRENTLRGRSPVALNATKGQCPRGHAYDGLRGQSERFCKQCQRKHQAAYDSRRRAKT